MKVALGSEVAHMWRTGDKKTRANYSVPPGSRDKNTMRATMHWFGPFGNKILTDFPSMANTDYGDLSNIKAISDKLNCKPFAWFLHRFKKIYVDGGIIPIHTFNLRSEGRCLRYKGSAGTSGNGFGSVRLEACDKENHRQRFHEANKWKSTNLFSQGMSRKDYPMSGMRAWNTDQCLSSVERSEIKTGVCQIDGADRSQYWTLRGGKLHIKDEQGCLAVNDGRLKMHKCDSDQVTTWEMVDIMEPAETKYYKHALKVQPELFKED